MPNVVKDAPERSETKITPIENISTDTMFFLYLYNTLEIKNLIFKNIAFILS